MTQTRTLDMQRATIGFWMTVTVALLVLPGAFGCTESPESLQKQIKRTTTGGAAPKAGVAPDTAKGSDSSSEEGADTPDAAVEEAEPKLQVRTLERRTREAVDTLRENYAGFLERESLNFGPQLIDQLQSDGRRLLERARALPETIRRASPLAILLWSVPFLAVALFGAAFFALTRQFGKVAHDLQARVHLELSRWATRIIRSGLLVVARVATVAVLVLLSYFPVKAIFGNPLWAELLTLALWHLLVYRAIASALIAIFDGRVIEITRTHASELEQVGITAAQFIIGFLFAIAVVQRTGAADKYAALLTFALRVTLVAFPAYLFVARDAVLDLLPAEVDSTVYGLFRRTLESNFRTFMAITAILLAFRAAGYVQATTFILVGGYAIVGTVVGSFALYAILADFFDDRVAGRIADGSDEAPLEGPDPNRLARRLEQLVAIGLTFAVGTLSLKLLSLLEPILILLRIPFLEIGSAEISLLTFVHVGLIVFGTVLTTKLLRALLNSRIYPLFEIDVGVAYAVNSIIKYLLVVTAFFIGLGILGVDLTAITVVVASLGVGIGFGLQTIIENLISGFILLFGQSVQKGDFITVEDTYGQVKAVSARSVVIKTPDNFEMLVPSKDIVGGRIINWSYNDNTVRGHVEVGVSYDADPEKVRRVLLETCETHRQIMEEPEPHVWLTEFGDNSVHFELLFFFDCRDTVEEKIIGELNFQIWEALEDADIEIPFPQRDLHVKADSDWEKLGTVVGERDASPDGSDDTSAGDLPGDEHH